MSELGTWPSPEPGPESEGEPSATRTLRQFPEKLAIIRLPAGAEIPAWAESSSLFSITASATETSLVCAGRGVPTKVAAHRGLTGFAIDNTIDASAVGVLADLLGALASADLTAHVLSTYETAWLLVRATDAERAAEAWRRRGHTVELAVPATPNRKQKKS